MNGPMSISDNSRRECADQRTLITIVYKGICLKLANQATQCHNAKENPPMSDLVVIAFPTEAKAEEVRQKLSPRRRHRPVHRTAGASAAR
jgi:hypothetical protein